MRCLDKALASFHVERQAYHGGSFIGNHVHSCLKVSVFLNLLNNQENNALSCTQPRNIHTLCSAPVALASQECPQLVSQAETVCDRFERALTLFSRCHNLYNSSKHLTSTDADSLGKYKYTCNM